MQGLPGSRTTEARIEVVTAAFVASGAPDGVHDLGRFLENLNNPAVSRQIELRDPTVRPLYRASTQLTLETPLLVQRDEIVFSNFEGPYYTRGVVRPPVSEVPVLLMSPPFQIQGFFEIATGSDPTEALRAAAQRFFVMRKARVYDIEGASLGQGEQIVVNGRMVQMMSATRQHIHAALPVEPVRRAAAEDNDAIEERAGAEQVRAA